MKKLSYIEQEKIIDYCIKNSMPLHEYLKDKNLCYDDLVYKNESKPYIKKHNLFVPVEKRPPVASNIPCVSFFSGAGGLDIGFKYAGFDTIADVEINEMFCDTLTANGAKKVLGPSVGSGDISNYDEVISHLESIGIQKNFSGVFHGGPPCQSFSIAANQRFSKDGDNFKRTGFHHKKYGNLLFCYIKIITHFLPEVFLIENVDGLLTIDGGEQVKKACELLKSAGYNVTPPRVVNAADYGVPQKRMRTLIVGSRIGHFNFPDTEQEQMPSSCVFETPIEDDKSNVCRNHNAGSIQRYMQLDYGQRDKLGRVDRLDPSVPSKTIIAGGTAGGGRSHLHPYIPRTMTVRECARLQTFPDSYKFTGSMARRFTQVGNAVPPVLAYKMAVAIYESIYA